jgi:hypothetical protein
VGGRLIAAARGPDQAGESVRGREGVVSAEKCGQSDVFGHRDRRDEPDETVLRTEIVFARFGAAVRVRMIAADDAAPRAAQRMSQAKLLCRIDLESVVSRCEIAGGMQRGRDGAVVLTHAFDQAATFAWEGACCFCRDLLAQRVRQDQRGGHSLCRFDPRDQMPILGIDDIHLVAVRRANMKDQPVRQGLHLDDLRALRQRQRPCVSHVVRGAGLAEFRHQADHHDSKSNDNQHAKEYDHGQHQPVAEAFLRIWRRLNV